MKARLILEDGTVFKGKAFGYLEESVGEVVFNTSMTGYGEVLTEIGRASCRERVFWVV